MASPSIVKKFLAMVNNSDQSSEDNLPIEYYELREIAKRRVLLKQAVKAHFLIYLCTNLFLLVLNFVLYSPSNIFEIWALIPIGAWGIALWIHLWVLLTDQIPDFRRKMFLINVAIIIIVIPFIIYMNYWANWANTFAQFSHYREMIWWPYILTACLIELAVHAYLSRTVPNEPKLDKSIEKEMEKLQKSRKISISKNKPSNEVT